MRTRTARQKYTAGYYTTELLYSILWHGLYYDTAYTVTWLMSDMTYVVAWIIL